MPSMTNHVELIILQPTSFCNINCSYCYLPSRNHRNNLEVPVVKALFNKLHEERMLGSSVNILWHAGEPLAISVDRYEEYMAYINDGLMRAGTEGRFVVQTNGTLINRRWCEFFSQHKYTVGVSLDGPAHIHDKYRQDRRGNGTFSKVMDGIKLLQEYKIPVYVIAVINQDVLDMPDEMFWFFESTAVKNICFNVVEIEDEHFSSSLVYAEAKHDVTKFFRRYFELLSQNPEAHWLREFSNTLRGLCSLSVHNAMVTPYEMITVDAKGNYSTFSPELLGLKRNRYKSFILGNILNHDCTFKDALNNSTSWTQELFEGVRRCSVSCSYYELCGGGSPSNKVSELGKLNATETRYCSLGVQACVDAALSLIKSKTFSATDLDSKLTSQSEGFYS